MTGHVVPRGWRCIRPTDHRGPCALVARWWNAKGQLWERGWIR